MCEDQSCCAKCKKKCTAYANYNSGKSYSGSEPWMTPKTWKINPNK